MTEASPTLHALDAAYQPFPTFDDWLARSSVDKARWHRYLEAISDLRRHLDPSAQRSAYEIVKRAAAMDTGAIEGFYEVDRGFTFTVAMEAAKWESTLAEKGERVRPLFEAQLRAYEYIMDLATKAQPFSEAAIRALHEEICSAQATYRVITAVGPQEHPLPKGVYKAFPNHVRTRRGTDHSYAPVDMTPVEMARLVQELRSKAFDASHPVIQAAFAHYALVVIHPFADGNGRVARALASAFTARAISMPIVILSEHEQLYLDSLETADQGNYQAFIDFMLDRSLETIKLVEENLRLALSPSAEAMFAAIQRLYVTRGGYTQEQVDAASVPLIDRLTSEVQRTLARFQGPRLTVQVGIKQMPYAPSQKNYRMPLQGGRGVEIRMSTPPPASASTQREYWVEVPKDAAGADDIVITTAKQDTFTAKLDELMPGPSGMLQTRISLFAERIVGEMLAELSEQAEKRLREANH